MRLPWPFGRAQRSPSSGTDAGAGPSGPSGTSAPVERPSGDAWRRLPPLAETVGPPPLVAPNRPFAAGLAAGEPPAPILAPLSHGRSLEAPRGIVVGVARPTQAAPGPGLPAPVQRSPLGARRAVADGGEWDSPIAEAEPASEPQRSPAAPAPSPSEPAAPPARRLAVADASPPAPARSLTRAPDPARPSSMVGLVGQPLAPRSTRAAARAVEPAAAAPVQRAPAESPVPTQSTIAPGRAEGPRLTIGQARRLGLGAPIAGGPVGVSAPAVGSVQRAPMDPGTTQAPAVAASASAGIQRAPVESLDLPLAGRSPAPASEEAPEAPVPAPALPSPAAIATPVAATPLPVAAATPGAAGLPARARSSGPIVSAQPLRARVQRAPLTLPSRAAEGDAARPEPAPPSGPSAGGVRIHRGNEAARLSQALDARSFTHGGEIFMPDSHGPLTTGKGKALLAHELTHVTQQRRMGSNLPAEHTSHGKALEAEAVAAERAPDMTLAGPASSPSRPAEEPAAGHSPAAEPSDVSRNGHAPAMSTTPQRAPASGGAARAGSGSGSGSGSGPAHSEQELEVLAHQLYQRIGRHLRRELLVDRERSGFALDLP